VDRREFLKSTAGFTGAALTGLAADPHGVGSALAAGEAAPAADPITPNASPEAKVVLRFIQESFGKKIMAAQHGG
jgi:hypothetical protein